MTKFDLRAIMHLPGPGRFVLVLLSSLVLAAPAGAAERGASTYIPGTYGDFAVALTPAPGVYVRETVFYYSADRVQKGAVDARIDANFKVNYNLVSIVTDWNILGARYNFAFGIPLIDGNVSQTIPAMPVLNFFDDRQASGDFFIVPVSLFWTLGNVSLNLYEYVVTPTGAFSRNKLANSGFGHWAFQTHLAATWLDQASGREISFNLGHVYNLENPDTNYKTGQEAFLEYLVAQHLSPSFAVGLQGYFYRQLTGDSGAGAELGAFKGSSAGIGPAILWNTKIRDQKVSFIGKWLHEFDAENRFKGNFIFGTLVLSFN